MRLCKWISGWLSLVSAGLKIGTQQKEKPCNQFLWKYLLLEGAVAYSYSWISWRYLLCFYEVIAMVTLWPLTFRTAPKWKKLTQFFYHEWLLDVVVEDWDITPILLMHFLKWICKCISFQSYWVLSDTLQQSMFDFIRRIFCCGRKNQPPICSPFLALKKLLFPLSYRVAWDDGCPVTTQANVRSWSRKKTELTCPKSLTNALRKAPRRTKKCSRQSVACEENQGEKKKLTLEELKKLSPPGYKEFEAAVGSKDLDEETALQLWEDIFKSLDIFEISKIAYINPTVITQPA